MSRNLSANTAAVLQEVVRAGLMSDGPKPAFDYIIPRKPDRKDKLGDEARARLVITHKINGKFLPPCTVALMRELIDHASYETGACFPAQTLLLHDCQFCERSLKNAREVARAFNLITWTGIEDAPYGEHHIWRTDYRAN